MSRCYADPVEVLRRNDEPAHFLWRSRLYVVRGVLAHWVETGEWWRSETGGPDDERPAEGPRAPEPQRTASANGGVAVGTRRGRDSRRPAGLAGRGPGHSATRPATATVETRELPEAVTDVRPGVLDDVASPGLDEEHQVWRVEASSGRSGTPGVYDLCLASSSGAWTLVRTTD